MHKLSDILESAQRLVEGGTVGKSLTGKELGKGITQRKDKLYQGSITCKDGKRRTVYGKTVSEVRDKIAQLNKEPKVQKKVPTLDEWFKEWLHTYKRNLRETTKYCYTTSYNRVGSKFGSTRLDALDLTSLQKAFNEFPSDMARKMSRMVLGNALNSAVKAGIIEKNIARDINIKVNDDINKEERRVLTVEETKWFKEAIKSYTHRDVLLLGLETGMRINELLALQHDCLDFSRNIIFVKQSLARVNGHFVLNKPKTSAGKRIIPMTSTAREILERNDKPSGYIFTTKNGQPVHHRGINHDLDRISAKISKEHPDFKHVNPHALRHTFATRCIERGMNPKTLQKILGHSTLEMTMNLYCHVTDETLFTEMKLLE